MIKQFGALEVEPELTILVREDLLKDGKAFMMDVVCIPILMFSIDRKCCASN